MAQTQAISHLTTPLSFTKSPNTLFGHSSHHHPKNPILHFKKPDSNGVIAKSIKADRRDNYDQLSKPGLKRREPSSAPIGLFDRFPAARTVQQMLDTMDRMIDDPVAFNPSWPSQLTNNGTGYIRGRTPWEIKEAESAYKMRFDMPGMSKDDVKVWVEEKMLVIKAEKAGKQGKEGEHNGGLENGGGDDWPAKSYGKYSSQIALPENVEFEKIKAEVKDGVLYVTVPKASNGGKVYSINVE